MSYFNTDDATFNPQLEKINETDRVHADTPNKRFEQLIKNDVSLKNQLDIHNHDSLYSNINHKHSEYITNENLGAKLNNIAKETSEYNIENKVKEISTAIGNINNSVSQNLQGVAKERSDYSIEDKVKELIVELNDIKKRLTKYYTLPNLKAKRVDIKQDTGAFSNKLVVDITGKGYLCSVVDRLDFTSYNSPYIVNLGTRFKIVVDDKTIFDFQLTDSSTGRLNGDSKGGNLDIGITIIPEKETFFDSYSSSSQNYSNTFVRHRMGYFYYNGNLTPALPGDIGESFLSLDENLKSYTLNNIRLENYSKDIYQYLALLDHPLRFEKNIKVYLSSNLKGASGAQPERTNLNGHMVTYTYSLDN